MRGKGKQHCLLSRIDQRVLIIRRYHRKRNRIRVWWWWRKKMILMMTRSLVRVSPCRKSLLSHRRIVSNMMMINLIPVQNSKRQQITTRMNSQKVNNPMLLINNQNLNKKASTMMTLSKVKKQKTVRHMMMINLRKCPKNPCKRAKIMMTMNLRIANHS